SLWGTGSVVTVFAVAASLPDSQFYSGSSQRLWRYCEAHHGSELLCTHHCRASFLEVRVTCSRKELGLGIFKSTPT
ncbi:hypothetical protein BKA82DRAFT_4226491, partial [Pisolithus tinctorius]